MADVSGTIGNEYVELNNAATEATLRLLLQATLATTKSQKDAIQKLATSAGLNPASINQVNSALQATAPQMNGLGKAAFAAGAAFGSVENAISNVVNTTKKLASGSAQASDIFASFSALPGPLGLVSKGFAQLAAFQEAQLASYQSMTKAGVNFGGSLVDLRLAASNTYMTMQEFSSMMKENGGTLARMGMTADQGARSFVLASNSLQKSGLGDNLRGLGYTAQEVNQGMLDYISITGGRSKKEMQNTDALAKGTSAYLSELDALAQITGKTKEEQEKALKEAATNAAWDAYLATLNPEESKKAIQGINEAFAKGGKGAQQAFMSAAQGLPPMTKEAQQYTAVARNMNGVTMQQASMIKDSTKSLEDMKRAGNAYSVAAVEDKKNIENAGRAIIMGNGELAGTMSNIFKSSTLAVKQGTDTLDGANKQRAEVEKNQAERAKSQAADAAKTQKSLQEFGQAIMALVSPIINTLLPVINKIIQVMAEFKVVTYAVITALIALKATAMAKSLTSALPSGAGSGVAGSLGKMGGGVKGLGLGAGIGIAGSLAADALGKDTTAGKAADVLGTAGSFAGTGAMIGSLIPGIGTAIGAGVGALAGGAYGLYQNFKAPEKMAEGGIVTKPTVVEAGEAGSEAIIPLTSFESLRDELQRLNTQSAEMIRYLRDTADYSKRNLDATRALSGDHFKF